MKRFVAIAIGLGVFAAAACADENIRAAQAKLKEGGFYFGNIDGAVSSDFSAAVTRYQIRSGLQITGNLNVETSKALGVKPEVTTTQKAAPDSETWHRLREPNRQFLARRTTKNETPQPQASSPQQEQPAPSSDARPKMLERTDRGLVLNPERLRDYVAAFVLAGLDPRIGAELEFFGDRVTYYGEQSIAREKIRADLERYAKQWPQRSFWLAGDLNVTRQPDSRIRVTFPLRYDLRNGSKHSSGKILKTLVLEVRGEDLQIVGVNERKA